MSSTLIELMLLNFGLDELNILSSNNNLCPFILASYGFIITDSQLLTSIVALFPTATLLLSKSFVTSTQPV